MKHLHPVVFIPGITASYLRDLYPIPPEVIWAAMPFQHDYDRVQLHPDNLRFEAQQPSDIRADQIFEIAYREFVAELRHDLSAKASEPVPVYTFGYDWRQPLAALLPALGGFLADVAERTRLLRHYAKDGYDGRVTLIGHSMGGLLAAGYLAQPRLPVAVAKLVTIATPYAGSYEAVVKMVTGDANIGGSAPTRREREAARLTPSLYHLLPSFPGAMTVEPPGKANLFDHAVWQGSIIDSIAAYIRDYGLDPTLKGINDRARAVLKTLLSTSEAFIGGIQTLRLEKAGLSAADVLVIAGMGSETRVRMGLRTGPKPEFVLSAGDIADRSGDPNPEIAYQTGDGTVPLRGAVPRFLDRERVVCVTPADFGTWEVQDKLQNGAVGFHGNIPNMNLVQYLVARFLKGAADPRGLTWGRPLPDVSTADWAPPFKPNLALPR